MSFSSNGLLVIGAGGMGLAIARRLGGGQRVFLADFSQTVLDSAANALRDNGHEVETHVVDVSSYESVTQLAKVTSEASNLNTVVNAAGISPSTGTTRKIFEVDLVGTANVIDAFINVMHPGSSLTTIASMAGHMSGGAIAPELEQHLATAPREKLLDHEGIDLECHPGLAYGIAKKGNIVRVQAAAQSAQAKGIRVNCVSPGVVTTAMIRRELESEAGDNVRQIIQGTPLKRPASADEIASLVAFLSSGEAAFIHGAEYLIDGGFIATQRFKGPAEASTT